MGNNMTYNAMTSLVGNYAWDSDILRTIQGLRFRVLGFRVEGLRIRVQDSGFPSGVINYIPFSQLH